MLLAEPRASVLSVGLSVGFTSQSNFYEAFREIEGSTPGQYRKLHAASHTPPHQPPHQPR
jgi:AraC-like DNA-binding protein